jgi:DNA-binding FrmR family transcriptional regulator
MREVIEDHIRLHVVNPAKGAERSRGAEELIEAVQSYLK